MQEMIYDLTTNSEFAYLKHEPCDYNRDEELEMLARFKNHPSFNFTLQSKWFSLPDRHAMERERNGEGEGAGNFESEQKIYRLITYDRRKMDPLNDVNKKFRMFRSVVVNPHTHHVVSFSTPKSIPLDLFERLYPSSSTMFPIQVEEVVEGTMISLFWDAYYQEWDISTRQNVGARTHFGTMTPKECELYSWSHYSNACRLPAGTTFNKSFRTMFFEAMEQCNLTLEMFEPKYAYTFVMQHVENRLVLRCEQCRLYLVDVFLIFNSPTDPHMSVLSAGCEIGLVRPVPVAEFRAQYPQLEGRVWYPRIFSTRNDFYSYVTYYATGCADCSDPGVMVRNMFTHDRTKLCNPRYEALRDLRGNQPSPKFRYLELRPQYRVIEFCSYFPEYKDIFHYYEEQIVEFVRDLLNDYRHCFILKTKPMEEVEEKFARHVRQLHRIYKRELLPRRQSVTLSVVQRYVADMPVSALAKIIV